MEGNSGHTGIKWPDLKPWMVLGNMSICLPPADLPYD
jgi:hypothetical protein